MAAVGGIGQTQPLDSPRILNTLVVRSVQNSHQCRTILYPNNVVENIDYRCQATHKY